MKKDVKTILISYGAVFFNAMVGILFTPFIIRQLGESQYGLYTISSSIIGFFLLDFGLGSASSRFITKYHVANDLKGEEKVISTIFRLFLILDVVVLVVLLVAYFSIDWLYKSLSPDELVKLKVILPISIFSSVICFPFMMLDGILTAYGEYKHIKIADLISKSFIVIALSFVLVMKWGLYAVVVVYSISAILFVAFKLCIIKKKTNVSISIRNGWDKELVKNIIQYSLWITVMAISHRLIFTIVPSILGIVSNTTEAAHFGVVLTIENYIYIISTAFGGMFMPTVSRIYNQDDSGEALSCLVNKVGKLIFIINCVLLSGLIFLGADFLRLWAGNGYDEVHTGLILVVFSSVFYNSMEILNTAVMVKNKVKYAGLISLFSGVLNIVLCFTFASIWGANGACVSIMISSLIRTIATFVMYNTVLNVPMKTIIVNVYMKNLPIFIISCLAGILARVLVPNNNWLGFIEKGVILVLGSLIAIVCFNKNEVKKYINTHK